MANLFEQNKKNQLRFVAEGIKFYEPSDIDKEEIKQILKENMVKNEDGSQETHVDSTCIRAIFNNLIEGGEFINDLTDKEIIEAEKQGNRNITLLMRSIRELIQELSEDVLYDCIAEMNNLKTLLLATELNIKTQQVKTQGDKFLKENNIHTTIDKLIEETKSGKDIEELLKQKTAKSSKNVK